MVAILLGVVLVVFLITVLNWMDKKGEKVELRPSVFDGPEHPSVDEGMDFTAGGPGKFAPKYKSPFVKYDPVNKAVMEPHDEAKDATGVSSGFGHEDYRKPGGSGG